MFQYKNIMNRSSYIIAEIGANHNGNMDLAFQLIDEAVKCGADCVKFQSGNRVGVSERIWRLYVGRNCRRIQYRF